MIYKPVGENVPDMIYLGSLTNFDLAYAWTQDKCVPLVREITFENGEVCFYRLGTPSKPQWTCYPLLLPLGLIIFFRN